MRRYLSRGLVIGLAFVLVAGCGTRSARPTPAFAHFSSNDGALSLDYPGAWQLRLPDQVNHGSFSSPIVFLATQPLQAQCIVRKTKDSESITCGRPLYRLDPGSIFVSLSADGSPGWTLAEASGKREKIAGRPARVSIERPGACASLGAQETISVEIDRRVPSNWYSLQACLRGPGLAARERQVRALLSSLVLHEQRPA